MKDLKMDILEALQIVQIVCLCVVSFLALELNDVQNKKCEALEHKLEAVRTELSKVEKELKHNNIVVEKIMSGAW